MDSINETSAGGASTGRYSLRSEQNNVTGNDNHHNEHHHDDNSSSTTSDSNDPPLSEYELLRLRKIKRNEARLAQLGLLVPSAATTTTAATNSNDNGGGGASALTTLFLSSSPHQPNNNNKKKKKRKKQQDDDATSKQQLVPRRILPKRTCTTYRHFHTDNNGYTSDDESSSSIAASPILPKRILILQPHQAAAVEAAMDTKKGSSSSSGVVVQCPPRRERRGRPRREDYVYKCDELCAHCGGEWRLNGDEDEEEDTRLIRCKDCRGAFHLDCMMLHGKSGVGSDEIIMNDETLLSGSKENNSTLQNTDKQDQATNVDDANNIAILPKRCFQCEYNKSKRSKRKALAPVLEAIVGKKKMVTVRISPELPLEAVVRGTSVTCYITLENS